MKFFAAFMALAVLVFAAPAFAQTQTSSTEDTGTDGTEIVVETDDGDVVVVDDTYDDEDVEEVKEVPSNFGLWWRGVKERVSVTFTFDPVAKAEKELRYAEERRQIFEKMMENADTDEARARAEAQLVRSEQLMERVENRRETWENADDKTRIEKLRQNVITSHVRRENAFDRLEEVVPEERLDAVQALRLRAQEHSQALLERVANAGENVPEEVKARIEAVKTFIAGKKEALENFQERKDELREELQDLTPEERMEKMEELNQERRELNQERVEKTKELLEQRKEKVDALKAEAAEGDEDAAAELRRVQQVNQQIRENVQDRRENLEEKREEQKEQVQEHRQDVMEQKVGDRPRVTQEEVMQIRKDIDDSMRKAYEEGKPRPIEDRPAVPPKDPALLPRHEENAGDSTDVQEDETEDAAVDNSAEANQ